MMAAYAILIILLVLLVVWVVIPAASLFGCAVLEGHLMKTRPQLSWLLPAGVMLASALFQQRVDGGSGLDALLWSLPAFYSRCAFSGTAAGAAIGAVMGWFCAPKQFSPA